MLRKWFTALGACALLVSTTALAQFNPNGQIQGHGWNILVPIDLGGHGANPAVDRLLNEDWGGEAWDIKTDDPKAGDTGPHAGWARGRHQRRGNLGQRGTC